MEEPIAPVFIQARSAASCSETLVYFVSDVCKGKLSYDGKVLCALVR
jgi:hypothetical protein